MGVSGREIYLDLVPTGVEFCWLARGGVSFAVLGCVLLFGICGARETIECLGMWKGNLASKFLCTPTLSLLPFC